MKWVSSRNGFTIVELLIVVVVIGVLAAITIVAYNGIQARANDSAVQAFVEQLAKKIETDKSIATAEVYPIDQASANLPVNAGMQVVYTSVQGYSYCVQATKGGSVFSSSSVRTQPQKGGCDRSGIIGQWNLNGSTTDSRGDLDGVLVGSPTLTTGQSGMSSGAYQMNGVSGISFARGYGLQGMTKSIWIRQSGYSGGIYPTVFDIGTTSLGGNNAIYLELTTSGTAIMAGAGVQSGGNAWGGTVNELFASIQTNQWVLLTQTLTPTTMKLYVNGNLTGSINGQYLLDKANQPFSVGYGRAQYQGSLDDIRVYGRALSDTEVQQLYASGAD